MQHIESIDELADFVRGNARVRATGGGTKPALSHDANVSLARLTGVIEYNPAEFTLTVAAGTKLSEIEQLLADRRQYLPFDPPWVDAGATIGGTVAAGLSGPGRFRYGGVRDFLLGVGLVTGAGEVVQLGGKVVKNAAGFDFPKLMVGSLGRFGVIASLTLKVFPAPEAYASVKVPCDDRPTAAELVQRLARSPLELTCLDVDCDDAVWARIGGSRGALAARADRIHQCADRSGELLRGDEESRYWRDVREFAWLPPDHHVVKAATTPDQARRLVESLDDAPARISAAGHVVWIAWPDARPREHLQDLLQEQGLRGMALTGDWSQPLLVPQTDNPFARRLSAALDPEGKFQR